MKIFKNILKLLLVALLILLIIFYLKKERKDTEIIAKIESEVETKPNLDIPEYDSKYIRNINEIEVSNDDVKNKYQFVFISDLHVSNVNENEEDEKIRESLLKRNLSFYGDLDSSIAKNTFKEIVEYTNNKNATALLLGGDIIDSPADSSMIILRENLNNLKTDYLYTLGNHDWSFLWDYHSEETKLENLPKFEEFMDDINVSYLEYEDLIVLAINSGSNQIEEVALSKIKEVLDKQKPTIVMMHVPISTEEIADFSLKYRDRISAVGDGGIEPDDSTMEAINMILSEDYKVFYILSGHVHIQLEADLNDRVHEFITEAAYFGNINVININ